MVELATTHRADQQSLREAAGPRPVCLRPRFEVARQAAPYLKLAHRFVPARFIKKSDQTVTMSVLFRLGGNGRIFTEVYQWKLSFEEATRIGRVAFTCFYKLGRVNVPSA